MGIWVTELIVGIYLFGYLVSILVMARWVAPRLRDTATNATNERAAVGFYSIFWPLIAVVLCMWFGFVLIGFAAEKATQEKSPD